MGVRMAVTDDVLVIGGGIAGSMAALAACEAADRVRLLTAAPSTLGQASGLVDVLGYLPGEDRPVARPLEAIEDLPSDHPYRRVGPEAVITGLEHFEDVVGSSYSGGERNTLVATTAGTVKPTWRYPVGVAPGTVGRECTTLLVGFSGRPRFAPELAARPLSAAGLPGAYVGRTVELPGVDAASATPDHVARTLESGTGVRETLADRIESLAVEADRVGLPPVLGTTAASPVRRDLAERLETPVFELPSGPPSLPGRRLEATLETALAEAGVRRTTGRRAVGATGEGTLESVQVEDGGRTLTYEADEFVLATGGLVGTGVSSTREVVTEPVFDCHVPHPAERYAWFDDAPFGDHQFARFGLSVDETLRPLGPDGELEAPNLRAAGAVLGGYDFAAECSGAGVSIATGVTAGRAAGVRA